MFLTALLLSLLPRTFAQGPYDPADNSRPNNITGLYYPIYGTTGSYYNGSTTFRLNLRDRNQDDDDDQYSGTVCHSFIGDSMSFTYTTVTGIVKNSPDYQETNPVMIEMYAVDRDFILTWSSTQRNYSEHQFFELHTASSTDGERIWDFSLQTTPSGFEVDGSLSKEGIQSQDLKFNLTNACGDESGGRDRAEEEYLFEGGLLTPNWYEWLWESWTDSVPWPTFRAQFDNETASIEVSGLFELTTARTAIVGRMTIAFQGKIDKLRSDELLMGGDRPEWNPTLGFSGDPGLVPNLGVRSSRVASGVFLRFILLAMGLGFWWS